MANPSVGSEQFISIDGTVPTPAEAVREVSREHVDGIALKKVGKRGRRFTVTAVRDVDTKNNLETKLAAYQAMGGTVVTIVDNQEISWANIAILEVPRARVDSPLAAVGGYHGVNGNYLVTQTFVCVDVSPPS